MGLLLTIVSVMIMLLLIFHYQNLKLFPRKNGKNRQITYQDVTSSVSIYMIGTLLNQGIYTALAEANSR